MTPRDMTDRAALIVGTNAVEIMDIEEYLSLCGWSSATIVDTYQSAVQAVESGDRPLRLAINLLPHADAKAKTFISSCMRNDIGLILLNGERTTVLAGKVIMLARPFVDQDFDDALQALGLSRV